MKSTAISGAVLVSVLAGVVLGGHYRALEHDVAASAGGSRLPALPTEPVGTMNRGFLYGRVTTDDGAVRQGRLRFGGGEEAFWGDYFNGSKGANPWATYGSVAREADTRRRFRILGFTIPLEQPDNDLGRPFMARFGDVARIEAAGLRHVRVTLKSGTAVDINRMAANDFDDGVRVWDDRGNTVDLASWAGGIPPPSGVRIRAIEFLPAAGMGDGPARLHATVHTRQGVFSGFVQWDRQDSVGTDALEGRTGSGALSIRFDTIRSIARSGDGVRVALLDGRSVVLSGTREAGRDNRGIYVDDPRYGRVLVSWDAFERIDFSDGGSGPAYDDFPRGHPLSGSVTTRGGRRLSGRIVYDLDESETTETLDAPSQGVDYTIPLGLVASITPAGPAGGARVTLHIGEALLLERAGDLGRGNGGLLVFTDGRERPEYVPWADVEQVSFQRPPAMYPPLGGG